MPCLKALLWDSTASSLVREAFRPSQARSGAGNGCCHLEASGNVGLCLCIDLSIYRFCSVTEPLTRSLTHSFCMSLCRCGGPLYGLTMCLTKAARTQRSRELQTRQNECKTIRAQGTSPCRFCKVLNLNERNCQLCNPDFLGAHHLAAI